MKEMVKALSIKNYLIVTVIPLHWNREACLIYASHTPNALAANDKDGSFTFSFKT